MNTESLKSGTNAARGRLLLRKMGVGIALLVLMILFSVSSEHFLTQGNLTNILTQITINLTLAVGLTFVILVGGIDLSVGSVLALAAVVAGMVISNPNLEPGLAIALAIGVGMLVGLVCGILNGALSALWGLPSFIITLGMLNIARGAALEITDAKAIYSFPEGFAYVGSIIIFGVPLLFVFALVLVLVAWFVLSQTVFGRMIYAIGNNEEAVRLAGHSVFRYKLGAFAVCGLCAGIAALIYMARLGIASPIAGVAFELDAIAAVIIGGTSLSGGKGSVIGTLFGACIIGVLANGLILLGLSDFVRQIITGLVIVMAVVLDHFRSRISQGA
jgi:ribose transport system permease protein